MELSLQRCFNHIEREAAARCPECGRFYCRECVTEHQGKVLCAECLARAAAPARRRKSRLGALIGVLQLVAGFWFTWLFFYYLARILLSLPTDFHDGTLWAKEWW